MPRPRLITRESLAQIWCANPPLINVQAMVVVKPQSEGLPWEASSLPAMEGNYPKYFFYVLFLLGS